MCIYLCIFQENQYTKMAKRTFVIGDIHGGYKALQQVLQRAKITRKDRLIFLGDYVDGWSESYQVIETLIKLQSTHNCIFIRGNHDDLFTEWIETEKPNPMWVKHGGKSTLLSYKKSADEAAFEKHYRFLKNLKNYYIDSKNRLFVHGGFSKLSGPKNEYFDFVFYWDRTLWETALAAHKHLAPDDKFYPERFTHFKEMFIGHTPTTKSIGSEMPYQALNLWNVDTGAAFKGKLSMMNVDTKDVFQSDPVHTLYPNENGRN